MRITTMFYLLLLLFPASSHALGDVIYIGEYCFDLVSSDSTKPTKTFKVGILSYGSGYYPVHGKATVQGVVMPVHGTAVLDGDSVYMTLNAAGPYSNTPMATTIYIRYDVSTSESSYSETYHFVQVMGAPISWPVMTATDNGSVTLHACT